MNLLPAALILGAVASGPALAQQTDNAIQPQGRPSLSQTQSLKSLQSGLQNPDETGQSSAFSQGSGQVVVPGVRFVVRDGAVYLTLFEGRAPLPMAGGGASGCFNTPAPWIEQKQSGTVPPKLSMVTPLTGHTPVLRGLYIYGR
jgi:hypothetical protein